MILVINLGIRPLIVHPAALYYVPHLSTEEPIASTSQTVGFVPLPEGLKQAESVSDVAGLFSQLNLDIPKSRPNHEVKI